MRDEVQDRRQLAEGVFADTSDETGADHADVVEELARADLPALHRRALRLTRDHHAAQDLVQDTLERAYRKRAHFQPGTSLTAWLACIMRNVWISNHRRRTGAPPSVPLDEIMSAWWRREGDRASACSDVEETVIDEMSAASIHLAIERLPPHLRRVVVLADVDETPYGTIAAALAIPVGTVASRLSRGRKRLQQALLAQARGEGYLARAS